MKIFFLRQKKIKKVIIKKWKKKKNGNIQIPQIKYLFYKHLPPSAESSNGRPQINSKSRNWKLISTHPLSLFFTWLDARTHCANECVYVCDHYCAYIYAYLLYMFICMSVCTYIAIWQSAGIKHQKFL